MGVVIAVDTLMLVVLILANLPLPYLLLLTSIAGCMAAATILDLHVTTRLLDIRIQRQL